LDPGQLDFADRWDLAIRDAVHEFLGCESVFEGYGSAASGDDFNITVFADSLI
jgi:hypothetical protein